MGRAGQPQGSAQEEGDHQIAAVRLIGQCTQNKEGCFCPDDRNGIPLDQVGEHDNQIDDSNHTDSKPDPFGTAVSQRDKICDQGNSLQGTKAPENQDAGLHQNIHPKEQTGAEGGVFEVVGIPLQIQTQNCQKAPIK